MIEWLPLAIYLILGWVLFMYVILDGFDLGIGINFFAIGNESYRDQMMAVVAPVWDGNETWMVLAAAILYGAFPKAFGLVLPAFYTELSLMVVALIARGISIEFRLKRPEHRRFWGNVFAIASTSIAFLQGVVIGHGLLGLRPHAVSLSVLPVIAGLGVCCGYALLGSSFLIAKTEGRLQQRCYRLAWRQLLGLMAFFVLVTLITPLVSQHVFTRWFQWPGILMIAPLPLASILCFTCLYRVLYRQSSEKQPFMIAVILFALAYIGQVHCLFPYVVPYQLTYHQAASNVYALQFVAFGLLALMPVLLSYTAYAYRVFKGKVSQYHY